ncbi:MAG: FHA domain-containing protein [Phycisphaerae bacterium]|nr:FHA domain-containing protein [Phycisphaerae bacterium]MBT7352027.1 FHA domain-containing protein [Phycisphaerae bacterium]
MLRYALAMLAIEVIQGPDRGRRFPLPPGEPQLLGRSSEAIPLTDRSVSRRHAELTPNGDEWLIRDLKSSNGTDVNGTLIHAPTRVVLGDTIRCGQSLFTLIDNVEFIAGPGSSSPPSRHYPPPMLLPTDAEQQQRVLAMIWNITGYEGTSAGMAELCSTLSLGLGSIRVGESIQAATPNDIMIPLRHADGTTQIALSFESPPEPWQHSAAELGIWLFETLGEAGRVAERDRLAAMGETVAVISHAVKNILQGLQGGAGAIELAISRGDLELAREGWPILARNLDRIHDLTFNMLAWSRTSHLDLAAGSIQSLIDEVVALQRPTFEQRRVRLDTAGEPLEAVPFDAPALHQAVLNLVLNALEAVPPRRGVVCIETSIDQQRQEAVLAVIDNGPGVPLASQQSIFEPFSSNRGQRGTGLGLAVTRRIAAAHGGRLVLHTPDTGGARFEIRLPLHVADGDPGDTDVPPSTRIDPNEFEP